MVSERHARGEFKCSIRLSHQTVLQTKMRSRKIATVLPYRRGLICVCPAIPNGSGRKRPRPGLASSSGGVRGLALDGQRTSGCGSGAAQNLLEGGISPALGSPLLVRRESRGGLKVTGPSPGRPGARKNPPADSPAGRVSVPEADRFGIGMIAPSRRSLRGGRRP
jgi:hypothetical protein